MTEGLQITAFPANEGDCLVLTYDDQVMRRRVLVDGGRAGTYKQHLKPWLETLPEEEREFELFVITHVDRDHIEGALALLEDPDVPVTFKDVWFNGYYHLLGVENLGPKQGELVSAILIQPGWRWNQHFRGAAVELGDEPVEVELKGGLTLRLLSPDRTKLEAMIGEWEEECAKSGIIPGVAATPEKRDDEEESYGTIDIAELAQSTFEPDKKHPNGTSIALLVTYGEKVVLLGADVHVDRLKSSLEEIAGPGGRVRLDLFKVSHHGSSGNVSRELLELVACDRYLISTNGSYFNHPKPTAISRIITFGGDDPELIFNYRSDETAVWDSDGWRRMHGYRTRYPSDDENGTITVEI